jgi:hypothetical protein
MYYLNAWDELKRARSRHLRPDWLLSRRLRPRGGERGLEAPTSNARERLRIADSRKRNDEQPRTLTTDPQSVSSRRLGGMP